MRDNLQLMRRRHLNICVWHRKFLSNLQFQVTGQRFRLTYLHFSRQPTEYCYVSESKSLHMHRSHLVARNWILSDLWCTHAEDLAVSCKIPSSNTRERDFFIIFSPLWKCFV